MSATTSPENAGSPARVRQPRSDRTAHRAAEAVKDQIHWHTRYAFVPMNLIRPAHGHPTGSLSLARDSVTASPATVEAHTPLPIDNAPPRKPAPATPGTPAPHRPPAFLGRSAATPPTQSRTATADLHHHRNTTLNPAPRTR